MAHDPEQSVGGGRRGIGEMSSDPQMPARQVGSVDQPVGRLANAVMNETIFVAGPQQQLVGDELLQCLMHVVGREAA